MREGRTEQTVFAGSVKGRIRTQGNHTRSSVNEICGAAVLDNADGTAVSTGTLTLATDDDCYYVFYRALNRMAASGGEALAVMPNLILPVGAGKDELKQSMDRFAALAEAENVDIADVRSGVSDAVRRRVLTVSCIGRIRREYRQPEGRAGLSVIMTGNAGCEGASILAHAGYEELKDRFSRIYLEEARAMKRDVPVIRDADAAVASGARCLMFAAGEGGILSALWDISAGLGCGLEADLRAVPVRQETVEICEALSLNPYTLHAGGSLLILTDEEEKMRAGLEEAEIPYAVIGTTRSDQKKLLNNGGSVQCLNRPEKDALLNQWNKGNVS